MRTELDAFLTFDEKTLLDHAGKVLDVPLFWVIRECLIRSDQSDSVSHEESVVNNSMNDELELIRRSQKLSYDPKKVSTQVACIEIEGSRYCLIESLFDMGF